MLNKYETLTIGQAASLAKVSTQTIYLWRKDNKFDWCFKPDSKYKPPQILIERKSFMFYLEGRRLIKMIDRFPSIPNELQETRKRILQALRAPRYSPETQVAVTSFRRKGMLC